SAERAPEPKSHRHRFSELRPPSLRSRRRVGAVQRLRNDITVESTSHLWAIGYPDVERAAQVKDEIVRLGWQPPTSLALLDGAVVVRPPDGSVPVDREAFRAASNVLGMTAVGFLAGLVVAAPAVGAAIGATLGAAGTAVAHTLKIGDDFVREVEAMLQPGTSAL